MQEFKLSVSITDVQREKLKKIAVYLKDARGTKGTQREAIGCLIDEVYAKITTPNYYKLKEKK